MTGVGRSLRSWRDGDDWAEPFWFSLSLGLGRSVILNVGY